MKLQERSKQEIEARLATMGDYVKIDYLQRALTSGLDFETKKFVMTTLSRLYEMRGMHLEAARLLRNAADINTTFKGKITDFMKSVQLYIKGGNYQDADFVTAQALALATDRERPELKSTIKNYYLAEAQAHMKSDKRSQAKKAYEKILTFELSPQEKNDVRNQLLGLYEKLGNIKEYFKLKENMGTGRA